MGDFRAAIDEHWRASEAGDIELEHAIYAENAEYFADPFVAAGSRRES